MQLKRRLLALLQLHIHSQLNSFNGLSKDNCKMLRETFWGLVHLILEIWQYIYIRNTIKVNTISVSFLVYPAGADN